MKNQKKGEKISCFLFLAATGTPPWVSILIVSILGTGYTTVGGIRAVIWTDTFQAVIMVIGMITVIILVSRET